MEIKSVAVEYSELRSNGYPQYGNKKFGVAYEASLAEGDDPQTVRRELLEKAMKDVKLLHGDQVGDLTLVCKKTEEAQF